MAANITTMHEYLEQVIGVTNQGMRNKLVTNGFTDLDALVRMKESNVDAACQAIRKTTGPAASREVSMVIQKRLEMLVSHVHYMYITDRTLDYNRPRSPAKLTFYMLLPKMTRHRPCIN